MLGGIVVFAKMTQPNVFEVMLVPFDSMGRQKV